MTPMLAFAPIFLAGPLGLWLWLLALCVIAVRARHPGGGQIARASRALAAMATTLPWFGLLLAQTVAPA